jgi:hypothetical protein
MLITGMEEIRHFSWAKAARRVTMKTHIAIPLPMTGRPRSISSTGLGALLVRL